MDAIQMDAFVVFLLCEIKTSTERPGLRWLTDIEDTIPVGVRIRHSSPWNKENMELDFSKVPEVPDEATAIACRDALE